MTLLDYFAGQFAPAVFAYVAKEPNPSGNELLPEERAARISYGFAKAMLEESAKEKDE